MDEYNSPLEPEQSNLTPENNLNPTLSSPSQQPIIQPEVHPKSYRYFLILSIIVIVGAWLYLYSQNKSSTNPGTLSKSQTLAVDNELIQDGEKGFGFRLLNRLADNSENAHKNIMISPESISQALSMAYIGSESSTKTEMAKTLGISNSNLQTFLSQNLQNTQALEGDANSNLQFQIANSIWLNQAFKLKPTYQQNVQQYFDAEAQNLDFEDPNSVNVVNDWIGIKTHNKILKALQSLNGSAVIVNTVYFKGAWANQFTKSQTKPLDFTTDTGSKIQTPTMNQVDNFSYLENDDLQMISLPYSDTGNERYPYTTNSSRKLSMQIILPKDGRDLNWLRQNLTASNIKNWQNGLKSKKVNLHLPSFTSNFGSSIKEQLKDMGMPTAFSTEADFSNLADTNLKISDVIHKTYIKLDEEGTEAAAVTALTLDTLSVNEQPKIYQMQVNRPFLYLITDQVSDKILFLGIMNNPGLEK